LPILRQLLTDTWTFRAISRCEVLCVIWRRVEESRERAAQLYAASCKASEGARCRRPAYNAAKVGRCEDLEVVESVVVVPQKAISFRDSK